MSWGFCLVFSPQRGEFSIFFARNIIMAIVNVGIVGFAGVHHLMGHCRQ